MKGCQNLYLNIIQGTTLSFDVDDPEASQFVTCEQGEYEIFKHKGAVDETVHANGVELDWWMCNGYSTQ